jgi:phosphoglycerate kinase
MLSIKDLDVQGKRIFLRVDFNVPLDDNQTIRDDTRIKAALPTLNHLLENRAKVVLASHLGRPKGEFNPKFSTKPVAQRLAELIPQDVRHASDVVGDEVELMKIQLKESQVLILENLRFHPGEKSNDLTFAEKLASKIDYYVNDAFGACHRAHASIVGIPQHVQKSAAGFLVSKEVEYLSQAVLSPKKPYVAILGGAKVSDKIHVIESLLYKAENILIGGAMAYTFFSAQGFDVGRSLVEVDKKELSLSLLDKAKSMGVNFLLPQDHIAATAIDPDSEARIIQDFPIPSDLMALDIGPQTIEKYKNVIATAKTIFWNGPMGVFEIDRFGRGTEEVAKAVADAEAISIIGGGDSVAAVLKIGVSDKISHISTGGGASLEYIANETLPGLEALTER